MLYTSEKFNESKDLTQKIGGKAFSLLKLEELNFSTARFFVIGTENYDIFLKSIKQKKSDKNVSTSETALLFKRLLSEYEIPFEIQEEIRKYIKLNFIPGTKFAIRSSATLEDSEEHSFAGQFESFLNVDSPDIILKIKDCWASLWSDSVLSYCERKGIEFDQLSMAVIVQEMVPADISGVAFTVDPGNIEDMRIEFNEGLAKSLVSGEKTPLVYSYNYYSGYEHFDLEKHDFNKKYLEMLREVREKIIELKTNTTKEYDLEWAAVKGVIYFLQMRPLTIQPSEADYKNTIWSSWFFDQRFLLPQTPLNYSLIGKRIIHKAFIQPLDYLGYRVKNEQDICKLFKGRLYTNINCFKIFYKWIPDFLIPLDYKNMFPGGYTEEERKSEYPKVGWNFIRGLMKFLGDGHWLFPVNLLKWRIFRKKYNDHLYSQNEIPATMEEKLALLEKELVATEKFLRIHRWSLVWAEIFLKIYQKYLKVFHRKSTYARLNAFHRNVGTITLKINQELKKLINHPDYSFYKEELKNKEAGVEANNEIVNFLKDYGYRSDSLDLSNKRWIEDPGLPISYMQLENSFSHSTSKDTSSQKTRYSYKGIFSKMASSFIKMREEQRFVWEKNLYNIRLMILSYGKALKNGGFIDHEEDIFFLNYSEIVGYSEINLRNKIQLRIFLYEYYCTETYRPFLNLKHKKSTIHSGDEIRGLIVSSGKTRGRVRIIRGPSDFSKILSGEIMVCQATNPSWSIVFSKISGLITERGGILSHGSILAREYELPCLTQVKDITQKLKTGDEVLLDANSGIIKLIKTL